MIEIKKLDKAFVNNDKKKIIFSNFSLSIKRGEKVGLFGPNGSGKTTLLNILSGVDKNFKGIASLEGKRVSYMHQDYNSTLLPWFSCNKNILLAREYHNLSKQEGVQILKQLVKELKIDFSLDQYPFILSGGQRQIVTLMRALVLEPEILFLDEPFSALDVERRLDVLNVLKKHFSKELTVIICSHRGDEIKTLLDRAIVLRNQPVSIVEDINIKKLGKQKFEQAVSKIRFRRNGYEI